MNKYYTHPLIHPLRPGALPERAQIVNYYHQNGRAVGLVLTFADGHRASLTFAEVERLQEAAKTAVEVEL